MARIAQSDEIGSSNRYILEDETYAIIGAAMEVYYKLGNGFAEPVYQEALGIEFELRDVLFEPQKRLHIEYKGRSLEKGYIADFMCFDEIIVEIKAIASLSPLDWSQIMNYLKASRLRVGLLFNFGSHGKMEMKRIVI
ncbi:MAG TPA: GxxExxY protein [Pyrinomonadaceae bacterium]|nr:GxxExxY protein [Pyrinomonadaceae bacterium]